MMQRRSQLHNALAYGLCNM